METLKFEVWDLHGLTYKADSISEGIDCLLTAYDELPEEERDYLVVVITNAEGANLVVMPGIAYLNALSTGKNLDDLRALDLPTWFDREDLQSLLNVIEIHMENEAELRMPDNRRRSDTFDTTGKAVRGVLRALKRL